MSHDQDVSSKAVLGYCNPMRAIGERQISSAVSTVPVQHESYANVS